MEDVKTEKKESLDLIDYRLTSIETTLAEMKNLLVSSKLQDARIDSLEETQKKIETKVDKNETDIAKLKNRPNEEKANKFDSVVNLIFKIFISSLVTFFCIKIGLK